MLAVIWKTFWQLNCWSLEVRKGKIGLQIKFEKRRVTPGCLRPEKQAAWEEGKGGKSSSLPSSSNCVSTPDGPGTEQTSLALRKVVQRLIRLLFPPTSFWLEAERRGSETDKDQVGAMGSEGDILLLYRRSFIWVSEVTPTCLNPVAVSGPESGSRLSLCSGLVSALV